MKKLLQFTGFAAAIVLLTNIHAVRAQIFVENEAQLLASDVATVPAGDHSGMFLSSEDALAAIIAATRESVPQPPALEMFRVVEEPMVDVTLPLLSESFLVANYPPLGPIADRAGPVVYGAAWESLFGVELEHGNFVEVPNLLTEREVAAIAMLADERLEIERLMAMGFERTPDGRMVPYCAMHRTSWSDSRWTHNHRIRSTQPIQFSTPTLQPHVPEVNQIASIEQPAENDSEPSPTPLDHDQLVRVAALLGNERLLFARSN